MKKTLLSICISFILLSGYSQSITFTFEGQNVDNGSYVPLQSVLIQNMSLECDTVLFGPNPILEILDVDVPNYRNRQEAFEIVSITPNPLTGITQVYVEVGKAQNMNFTVFDLRGISMSSLNVDLTPGTHVFEVSCATKGIMFLCISSKEGYKSVKLVNLGDNRQDHIKYHGVGNSYDQQMEPKSIEENTGFLYNFGDQLEFIVTAVGYEEVIMEDAPTQSTDYTFQMNPEELIDGFYVVGDNTACPFLNLNGLMKMAVNHATLEIREELKEIYIAVEGGSTGFNIVRKENSIISYHGPGDDFILIPEYELNPDEPQLGLWRGSLLETEDEFIFSEDGLYHVIIDEELMVVTIAKVDWGIIGDATPGGWVVDTPMPPTEFNLYSITSKAVDVPLSPDDWKFRYSSGWIVMVDPYYDNGNGNYGIIVYSSLGGSVDNLFAGGPNIFNEIHGVYDVSLFWNIGQDYTTEMIKTGDYPELDWTGVILDAVGDGISQLNPEAIPDPSSWAWGYKLIADNEGVPSIEGSVYTWTWDGVILEENLGFKLRTEDGEIPANGNGSAFDVGYDAVDTEASSEYVGSVGIYGDIIVTVGGSYDITLTLDALDGDSKRVTIVEATK